VEEGTADIFYICTNCLPLVNTVHIFLLQTMVRVLQEATRPITGMLENFSFFLISFHQMNIFIVYSILEWFAWDENLQSK
jgi:hypothetical protein